MKLCRFLLAVSTLFLASCAWLGLARSRPARTMTILYTGDLSWTQLPELASLVKATEPTLTIIDGRFLDGGPITERFNGLAEAEALAHSGVNAVCVTPELLLLGTANARRVIDSAASGVFFLGANLLDSARKTPFGQAVVKAGRPGSKSGDRLALLGLFTDSSFRQHGLVWQNPDLAIRKTLPQMKMNADLFGAVLYPSSDIRLPGFDFAIGSRAFGTELPGKAKSPIAFQLELQLDANGQLTGRRVTEVNLTNVEPDPGVQSVVRRWQDSLKLSP